MDPKDCPFEYGEEVTVFFRADQPCPTRDGTFVGLDLERDQVVVKFGRGEYSGCPPQLVAKKSKMYGVTVFLTEEEIKARSVLDKRLEEKLSPANTGGRKLNHACESFLVRGLLSHLEDVTTVATGSTHCSACSQITPVDDIQWAMRPIEFDEIVHLRDRQRTLCGKSISEQRTLCGKSIFEDIRDQEEHDRQYNP